MKSSVVSFILFSLVLCCTGSLRNRGWNFRGFSPVEQHHEVFENATHCTPGTQFYLACNICYCRTGIKSGSMCANNGCPPLPPLYDFSAHCTPGTRFKMDCNDCTCGNSGIVGYSGCTRKACSHSHP